MHTTAGIAHDAAFPWLSVMAVRVRRLGVRASRMLRSQVINNDLNPKWDEDFKILVHEPEHQVGRLVQLPQLRRAARTT